MRVKKCSPRNAVIFLVGPTAVGKTEIAIQLAKKIKGEIISCDSMQLYKGMRILSQAPTIRQRRIVRHHLVGVLDPKKESSVAFFRVMAERAIRLILKRKKIPIVVGGSGLYVKSLIDGLFPSPGADARFRHRMQTFADRYGSKYIHRKLAAIDPETSRIIHPNDTRRIIRALEIRHLTGKTMSEIKKETKGLSDRYDIKIFGITRARQGLYDAINTRVDVMFEDGLIHEVRRLVNKRLSITARAVLGFKEMLGYINGEYYNDEARELLKRNTRRFAKRQLTWFRVDKRIQWFDRDKLSEKEIVVKISHHVMVRRAHHPSNPSTLRQA